MDEAFVLLAVLLGFFLRSDGLLLRLCDLLTGLLELLGLSVHLLLLARQIAL